MTSDRTMPPDSHQGGTLTVQRRFLRPEPDETMEELAVRALPDETPDSAIEQLKSWNLHIYMRRPPGVLLGSDIVFTEAPAAG